MNMDVEEMPISHSQTGLSINDIETIKKYRRNDVNATLALLYLTIGQPGKIVELNGGIPVDELNDYQDANKIEQRLNISRETGMSCLNWSDVEIGEQMNKLRYMQAKNVKFERDLLPKKVKHPYGQKFKKFFPATMSFQTKQLKDFVADLGEKYVLSEKQEFPIKIGNTTYTIAKGGIHSTESNRCIVATEGMTLDDEDVGLNVAQVKLPKLTGIALEPYTLPATVMIVV